jgi:hypothetical protein
VREDFALRRLFGDFDWEIEKRSEGTEEWQMNYFLSPMKRQLAS